MMEERYVRISMIIRDLVFRKLNQNGLVRVKCCAYHNTSSCSFPLGLKFRVNHQKIGAISNKSTQITKKIEDHRNIKMSGFKELFRIAISGRKHPQLRFRKPKSYDKYRELLK